MSRDSVYQQLRGHLAYLKPAAAAEALPAHLDQAHPPRWYRPYRVPRSVLSNSPAARRSMTKSLVIERRAKGNRHCSAFS